MFVEKYSKIFFLKLKVIEKIDIQFFYINFQKKQSILN
jgi:hypothetical protein